MSLLRNSPGGQSSHSLPRTLAKVMTIRSGWSPSCTIRTWGFFSAVNRAGLSNNYSWAFFLSKKSRAGMSNVHKLDVGPRTNFSSPPYNLTQSFSLIPWNYVQDLHMFSSFATNTFLWENKALVSRHQLNDVTSCTKMSLQALSNDRDSLCMTQIWHTWSRE